MLVKMRERDAEALRLWLFDTTGNVPAPSIVVEVIQPIKDPSDGIAMEMSVDTATLEECPGGAG